MSSEDTSPESHSAEPQNRLGALAEQWRACRAELARLRRLQDKRLMAEDADGQEFFELADLEDALRRKSKALVRAMMETPAESVDDILSKLSIWREAKCPKGTKLSGKTIYNHLAVSALEDVADFKRRCTCKS